MFEKEAEEWTISHVCKDCSRYEECKSKEHCTCKECSKEKWQNGAMFGYNKANEWHKVADGDYPPCEKGNYTISVLTDKGDIAYYSYNYDCWIAEPSSGEIDPPEAWCMIPEYVEE